MQTEGKSSSPSPKYAPLIFLCGSYALLGKHIISLTTDLLWAAGSFLHHIQDVLPLSLAQRCGDGAAVGVHGHHGAILQALVQTAAASRAVPQLARGTRIALIIRAY